MSDIVGNPETSVEIRTLDRSEVGLSFRRRLKSTRGSTAKELDTPTKTIPAGKLYHEKQVSDDARGANEFYAEVSTDGLEAARKEGDGLQHHAFEKQLRWSREEEFDFSFIDYSDAHQIVKLEAYQMAGILANYSDFLTVPRQEKLFSNINPDNGLDDLWYQRFRNGTEFFLQACHERDNKLPIMGAIPPLNQVFLDDLINLYELYDVFAFYFDYNWDCHPSKPNQVARMGYLMRRVRNQRIHEDVLFYALNARRGDFDKDVGFRPAGDFATALMGIDIIGGNHTSPSWPKEVFEQIERNEGFQVFRPGIMGYIESPIDRLEKNTPDNSSLDIQNVMEKSRESETARRKLQKILNSELQSLDLADLREALENSNSEEYLDDRRVADEFLEAGKTVREAFEEGAQAKLGEWT